MSKSKKGSAFEREICKMLSRWWTNDERDDVFWRSAGSGAMAKTRSKSGRSTFGQYGDIQATDPIGQPLIDICTIELKRGYSKNTFAEAFDRLPRSRPTAWEGFVAQARKDAKLAGSFAWLLIVRRDRHIPLVFMPSRLFRSLKGRNDAFLHTPAPHARMVLHLDGKRSVVHVMSLMSFLSQVKPESILELNGE